MTIEIRDLDFDDSRDCAGVLEVLDAYAAGPEGGNTPLASDVRQRLIGALREQASAVILLAHDGQRVVGIATCFLGFSTFYAQPLLNVHDLAVLPDWRGRGIGRQLLRAAADRARARGCCKLTLEVRQDNARARHLYESEGFRDFELAGKGYVTLFLAKPLG